MLSAIARRAVWAIGLVLIVSFLVFSLSLFLPGDPAVTLAGESASPERVAEVRERLGFDAPVHERYVAWLADAAQGDLGRSLYTRRTVVEEIGDRWPVTVSLMIGAVLVAVLAGLLAGVWAGSHMGGTVDRLTTVGATIGVALPQFVLGVALIIVFTIWLGILPIAGYVPFAESQTEWARHLVLPVLALSADMTAQLARQVRAALATALRQDFIRTAYAKGAARRAVVFKHGLRMALSPAVAIVGVQVARMLGGAVVLEQVFSLPGLGSLTVNAILTRDLPVLQGIVPLAVVVAVAMNLLADIGLVALNPRLRQLGARHLRVVVGSEPRLPGDVTVDLARPNGHGLADVRFVEAGAVLRSLVRNRAAAVAAMLVAAIVVLALSAPLLTIDPAETDLFGTFADPGSDGHLLGADDLGRDILSRVLHGARVSLVAGVGAVGAALVAAIPLGLLAGYVGGRIDDILMRIVDVLLSIPPLILVFAIAGIIGPSLKNAIIALAYLFTPVFLRLTRSETRQVRHSQLVESERALGLPATAIVWHHVLPAVAPALIVQASLNIGTAIIVEASLSFLGLGVRPPTPSWGGMVSQGLQFLRHSPWAVVFPSVAIAVTVLSFNVLGDGLRDALAQRERE